MGVYTTIQTSVMKLIITISFLFSFAYGQYKMPVMVKDGAGNSKPALVGWKYSAVKSQIWKATIFVTPRSKAISGYARFVMKEEVRTKGIPYDKTTSVQIDWAWDKVGLYDASMRLIKLGDGGYIQYVNPATKKFYQDQ
jgi:hypothetical protein